jgi:hypothetical protein
MRNPMLRLVLIIGVTILLLMAGVASAGPRGAFAPRRAAPPARAMPAREMPPQRMQEQRPPGPAGAAQMPPQQRSGRMSPEERSALRAQIRDDSRSVYRPYQPYQPYQR